MENKNILDDGRVGRLLFTLSLPAFIGMAVMTLYNIVDTIFIGHFVGSLGIAALAIVFPVQMIASGIGHLMGMGGRPSSPGSSAPMISGRRTGPWEMRSWERLFWLPF